MTISAPFPWFGGKSRVSHLVWGRFGNAPNYVEPFAGSLAVLLARPHQPGIETVNDLDCYVANFWRAVQSDPAEVERWADWPVNEADLHARHLWLVNRDEFRERMKTDPDYYDAKIAGWWVWGISCWIGGGWCEVKERQHRKRPQLMTAGKGMHRLAGADFAALAERLRRVRVCCGDWTRILGPSPTEKNGITAVFLDPPYDQAERDGRCYATDGHGIAKDVRAWAIANGANPMLRIALCGYEGEHAMPPDWSAFAWKAGGGYGSQGERRARENASRERIWFSPHCLAPEQPRLL